MDSKTRELFAMAREGSLKMRGSKANPINYHSFHMVTKKDYCECGCSEDKHDKKFPRLCSNCQNCEGYALNDFELGKRSGAIEELKNLLKRFTLEWDFSDDEIKIEIIETYLKQRLDELEHSHNLL